MQLASFKLIAIAASLLLNLVPEERPQSNCAWYQLYWFKVSSYVSGDCFEMEPFLEPVQDYNLNQIPDFNEVVQGNDIDAMFAFGCNTEGDYCCAMGFRRSDIEWVWPGMWRPTAFASPYCVVYRNN